MTELIKRFFKYLNIDLIVELFDLVSNCQAIFGQTLGQMTEIIIVEKNIFSV